MSTYRLLFMAIVLGLAGCGGESTGDTQVEELDRESSPLHDLEVESAFPEAVRARLFVAVDYEAEHQGEEFTNPEGAVLNEEQLVKLKSSLNYSPLPEMTTACFVPHHFFRFYDEGGDQIGELSACFCCFGVRADGASNVKVPEGYELSGKYSEIAKIVRALGEQVEANCHEDELDRLENLGR